MIYAYSQFWCHATAGHKLPNSRVHKDGQGVGWLRVGQDGHYSAACQGEGLTIFLQAGTRLKEGKWNGCKSGERQITQASQRRKGQIGGSAMLP